MNFNINEYETVKSRKYKFYNDYKDGRIIVQHAKIDEKTAVFKTVIFKNKEEQQLNLPWATGYAQEFKEVGGFANKFAWCENCEESSVGRALDNAGYAGKPSQEEMKKVQQHEQAEKENKKINLDILKTKRIELNLNAGDIIHLSDNEFNKHPTELTITEIKHLIKIMEGLKNVS